MEGDETCGSKAINEGDSINQQSEDRGLPEQVGHRIHLKGRVRRAGGEQQRGGSCTQRCSPMPGNVKGRS